MPYEIRCYPDLITNFTDARAPYQHHSTYDTDADALNAMRRLRSELVKDGWQIEDHGWAFGALEPALKEWITYRALKVEANTGSA